MAKSTAMFFASLAFIIITMVLFTNSILYGTIDPLCILSRAVFLAAIAGLLGFYLGRIFEEARDDEEIEKEEKQKKAKNKDDDLIIDDILIYDIGIPKKKEKPKEEEKEEINE